MFPIKSKNKEIKKKIRNPNGYGTVYKLQGNRRRPWVASITKEIVFENDKRKQKREIIGYFETDDLAYDACELYRLNPAAICSKSNITLKQLYDEWSPGKYEYISRQTADCYRAAWKHLSIYGNVKFKELRKAQFQSVVDKCYKSKMGASSLKNIKIVGTMLYDYATQNDIVNKNYAEFVTLPKVEKTEKEIFNDLEIQKLEKSDVPWADTILILIYTGFRINEFLGLTKFNIDFDKQIITGGLKTEAGKNRPVPINPKILKFVKKWYDRSGDRLICDENGKRILDKYYREHYYYPVLKQLGIRELTPHACRHTCASLLSKAGANTKAIQDILGHAKYSFTADNYTHKDLEELRQAMNKI